MDLADALSLPDSQAVFMASLCPVRPGALTFHLFPPPAGRPVGAAEGRSLVPHALPLAGSAHPPRLQSESWGRRAGATQRL